MSRWKPNSLRSLLIVGALALTNCGGSQPPRLFMLSPSVGAGAISDRGSSQADVGVRPGQSLALAQLPSHRRLGVVVTIPQYLERPDIMVRTGNYEMVPLTNARWAEGLSLTASRVLAADLGAALPSYEFMALPTGTDRRFDDRVAVELSGFETDARGKAEISGRWTIVDGRSDRETMSRQFHYAAEASATDPRSIAEALSGLLARVSSEIVPGIESSVLARRG